MSSLVVFGLAASVFVGFNVGGSSTGVAWGPSVGAGITPKTAAAGLMTLFALVGGWTVGRNVITTLAEDVLTAAISLEAGIAVLAFIGFGILAGNLLSVPVSTSMTTVGGIAGLGLATGTLDFETIGRIVSWWILAPFIGFFTGMIIGRHLYHRLARRVGVTSSEGPLFVIDRSGPFPKLQLGPGTTSAELVSKAVVVGIGCYMAFSAGASNVPNAVAPLVSSGAIGTDAAILVAGGAIGAGAFTIARRTMESVGTELTDISLFAALLVMVTSATITTGLSWLGIPISLAMATVMTIAGLGWGRATRPITLEDAVRGNIEALGKRVSLGAVTAEPGAPVPEIGGAETEEVLRTAGQLFDRKAIARYVSMWIISPSLALVLSYAFFALAPIAG